MNRAAVRPGLAMGLAVLAVALAFGLLLYAGGGQAADASNAPPPEAQAPALLPVGTGESNKTPTPVPELHATPIACPDTTDNPLETAEVVSEGRHAVFEVYWSSATVNLTANPCPPSVIHLKVTVTPTPTPTPDPDATPTPTPTGGGSTSSNDRNTGGTDPTPTPTPVVVTITQRAASNINLDTTVLHVPETVKQTRPDDETADTSYRTKYPFLYKDTDNDDVVDTALDGTDEFWPLPYCDPDYKDFEWQSGDMCMGFSTALLHEHHFLNKPKGTPPGKITWELESKREPGIDQNDKGQVYLFLPHDEEGVTPKSQVTWNSLELEENELVVDPETYTHRQWGFTKPGTYELSVHAWGYPQSALGTGAVQTATSVPRIYRFHVGLLADLGVTATVSNSSPNPGDDDLTLTITASNKGPDKAENTKVKVKLPEGLSVAADTDVNESTGDYDRATGIWDVGDMEPPAAGETATEETLTLTVTVASTAARGTALDTVVEIYATEDIGETSHVRELDPHTHDNEHTITITPLSVANAAPYFHLSREIAENSAPGSNVGAPIGVKDPNSGDTLTYSLSGTGHDLFAVSTVATGAQIQVAAGVNVNYEDASHYDLTLGVSDGKDANGNADTSDDATIAVRVNVTDVASETLAVTLSADRTTQTVGENATFTALVTANSSPTSWLTWNYTGENADTTNPDKSKAGLDGGVASHVFTATYDTVTSSRKYWVTVVRNQDGDLLQPLEVADSSKVAVQWTAAGGGG